MLNLLTEMTASYKVGILAVTSPFVLKFLATLGWIGANINIIGLFLTALLTIVLIVSHFCKLIWQNRTNRENTRKNEVEIEELNLRVRLLKWELEHKEKNSNNNK